MSYIIRLAGAANDTELPELEYDWQADELSFNWVAMLDAFCKEQAELNRRHPKGMRTRPAEPPVTDLEKWKTLCDYGRDLRDLRRQRLTKEYRERCGLHDHSELKIDESSKTDQLESIRLVGSPHEHAPISPVPYTGPPPPLFNMCTGPRQRF
jgi:hypothetical protein